MTLHAVEITLVDPVITSFDVATAATPTCHSYLPGAMLWGVLASAAYCSEENRADILSRLHGGGLIIGDAWPMIGADVALPIPKSLHRPKDGGPWEDWSDGSRNQNYTQAKDGQVGPSCGEDGLAEVAVRRVSSLRTAINPDTLTAADGQFYGLQALAAGQKFVALLAGEGAKAAVGALSGEHFLGRSRNAEFGRVTIRSVDVPRLPELGEENAQFLWCLSDFAAHDVCFLPTERPDRLFGQRIDWSKSYVRHRSYSPFNAAWKRRQPERLVIGRGSVLVLKDGIKPGLQRAGFWQEQGLGLMLACATSPLSVLKTWIKSAVEDVRPHEQSETDLTRLLKKRAQQATSRATDRATAQEACSDWQECYAAASRLQEEVCGPTPSQWAVLVEKDEKSLRDFLTKERDAGGAKETLSWQARFAPGAEGTFAGKALALLDRDGAVVLNRTAKALRAAMKRERWFDER